jgi:uncharacterized SAM-dependent methyltransferase
MEKTELIKDKDLKKLLYTSLKERKLPDFLLYIGQNGAENWINLVKSTNFSYAKQQKQKLQKNIPNILKSIPYKINIVSIGVGTGEKESIIIQELVKKSSLKYYPIDMNSNFVDLALKKVDDLSIEKKGFVGFIEDLDIIKTYWEKPIMLCIFGNTFCNFKPKFILNKIKEIIDENDFFLIELNIAPNNVNEKNFRKEFNKFYKSKENIKFNIQPIVNLGIPLEDIEFNIDLIPQKSATGILYKSHKSIKILKNNKISIDSHSIDFKSGDIIKMGFTYKYNINQITSLLTNSGFLIVNKYTNGSYLLLLTKKQEVKDV